MHYIYHIYLGHAATPTNHKQINADEWRGESAWERSSTLDNLCVNSISIQIHATHSRLTWAEPNGYETKASAIEFLFLLLLLSRGSRHWMLSPISVEVICVYVKFIDCVCVSGATLRFDWQNLVEVVRSSGRGKGFAHEICKLETISFPMCARHTFCHFGSLCSLNLIDFHVTAKCWVSGGGGGDERPQSILLHIAIVWW